LVANLVSQSRSSGASASYPNPVTSSFSIPSGHTMLVASGFKIGTGGSVSLGVGSVLKVLPPPPSEIKFATKTSDYTLTASDEITKVDCSGGAITITLPDASNAYKQRYEILAADVSGGVVTITTTYNQTISGDSSFELSTQYENLTVVPDGSNWLIL